MEYQGQVTKKRLKAKPGDFSQLSEVAFYVASKKKQAVALYTNNEGLIQMSLDTKAEYKNGFYKVDPDGKIFHVPYVAQKYPLESAKQEKGLDIAQVMPVSNRVRKFVPVSNEIRWEPIGTHPETDLF